ncbi:Elongation factor G-like protein [Rhodovastum atsumiense]|uniref:Elongation factor G n=1 Tax=Rhodovastum atsumiense TaxID=504468 RepID=A0A5M6IMB7_9PROT|nr:elongation factor G [Rhodovastum atsumiense]KAA5608989.1 elongation factor G [Rhodovastum atsumiense]CAH2599096.1 Elongation factor G-like protein [Rhodovastum atsumiense]
MSQAQSGPRTVAIVGPYGSGKSTLFDALIAAAGGPARRGAAPRGSTRIAHCTFLDEPWALIDCPGSVESAYEAEAALAVADIAVVVCDPDPARVPTVAGLLRRLEEIGLPTMVFVNRIDTLNGHVRDTLAALQGITRRPLVLREVPIREGETVTGYVDVVSERAYQYRKGAASELIALPDTMRDREQEARAALVEVLADHDDALLEKVVDDIKPTPAEVFERLRLVEAEGHVTEVLLGCAERDNGVRRLWKALRHDAPAAASTAERHLVAAEGAPLVQVFRTLNAGYGGKLSWARIWRGPVKDGATLEGGRIGGMWRAVNGEMTKILEAGSGEIVALGRLEGVATGAVLGEAGDADLAFPPPPPPVYAMAITTADRKDDVRLSGALQKLVEEDPALTLRQDADLGETILAGQGELHLRASIERLANAFGVRVNTHRPRIGFRETIRKPVHQHARLKRQTGGHGQFADVTIDIAPRARGEGYQFVDKIVGGVVPRQFIPAVGEAAEEAARKGAYGYPVVDISVTLVDGGFHSVDSSDMAFRTAARMAMQEALPKADPVLLEPMHRVTVTVPNSYTATAQRLLTGRRGQILGYGEREGWSGWDDVEALVPEAELHDFIIELRSQTMGLGSYRHHFDHLAEAHGKVVQEAQKMAAG